MIGEDIKNTLPSEKNRIVKEKIEREWVAKIGPIFELGERWIVFDS